MKKAILFIFMMIFSSCSMATHMVFGDWSFEYGIDETTGHRVTYIYTIDRYNPNLYIAFDCKVFSVVVTNMKEVFGNSPAIEYRADKNQPNYVPASAYGNLYFTGEYMNIFNNIKNGKNALIRVVNVKPYIEGSFSLKGLTAAYNRLQRECYNF